MNKSGEKTSDIDRRELDYQAFIQANLNKNYVASLVHGMLGMTGFRILFAPTFIPAYLYLIAVSASDFVPFGLNFFKGPDAVVGLGLTLLQVGAVLTPIVGTAFIEHRPLVLPSAVWLGALMRVQILGLAVTGWIFLPQEQPKELLIGIMLFLFTLGLFVGIQRVAFQFVFAKVIPVNRRGRLQAIRNVAGGIVAAVLSLVAGEYFIGSNWLGNGYSATFLFAFFITSFGLIALHVLTREPELPQARDTVSLSQRLSEIPRLLLEDKDFAFFIIAQLFAVAGRVAAPFYILYASQTIELSGPNLGLVTVVYLGADTLSNILWGYLGDRSGFRSTFAISMVLAISATLLLLNSETALFVFLAFFGLGASNSGYMMSAQTMVLEFGKREDIAMRLAFSSTAESLMMAIGPLTGGVVATVLGYTTLFSVSIILLFLAFFVLMLLVKEPRLRTGVKS